MPIHETGGYSQKQVSQAAWRERRTHRLNDSSRTRNKQRHGADRRQARTPPPLPPPSLPSNSHRRRWAAVPKCHHPVVLVQHPCRVHDKSAGPCFGRAAGGRASGQRRRRQRSPRRHEASGSRRVPGGLRRSGEGREERAGASGEATLAGEEALRPPDYRRPRGLPPCAHTKKTRSISEHRHGHERIYVQVYTDGD